MRTIPPRLDADSSVLEDAMLRREFEDLISAAASSTDSEPKLLPGYASLTSLDFRTAINPALLVFAVGGAKAAAILGCKDPDNFDPCPVPDADRLILARDLDYIVTKLRANYGLLLP
jgi:hypothetical protein